MKKKILIITAIIILIPIIIYLFFPGVLINMAISSERSDAGLSISTIRVNNHNIVYSSGGKGDTVLLVHGFSGNKDNWTRFAKYLTLDYYIIAPDLPGFGESTKIKTEKYRILDQVKRLDNFCKALNLEKFHIVGNSMGGSISGCYTLAHPEKVLSLALFNTGSVPSGKKSEMAKLLEKGINIFEIKNADDFERMIKYIFVKPPPTPGFVKEYFYQEYLKSKEFNDKVWIDIRTENYSLEPNLKNIKTKTLVLWGDTDKLLDVSCVKILEKGLPNCKSVIMKDCGHAPMMERPEETAGHYKVFL